jgi:hypothetical protein
MLMKTGLSATAEPSSLPENSDSRRWPSHQVLSSPVNDFSFRQSPNCSTLLGLARGGRDLKTSRAFAKQQYSTDLGCRVTREETALPPIHPNWRVFSYLNAGGYHRKSGCSPRRVTDGVPMQNPRKSSLWLVAGPCSSLCARRGLSPRLLFGASLPPE